MLFRVVFSFVLISVVSILCRCALDIYLPATSSRRNKCPTRFQDKNRALAHFEDLRRVLCLVIVHVLPLNVLNLETASFIYNSFRDYKVICTFCRIIHYDASTNSYSQDSTARLSPIEKKYRVVRCVW